MNEKIEIIKHGVNVRECQHINAYNPNKPICQMSVGIGGSPSECNGNCAYVDKLKIHNEIQQLKEENEKLKAENDELKKQVNDLLNKPETQDKILWKIDNEALLGSKDAWAYKLEQTLIEIKEITKKVYNDCDDCTLGGKAELAKQILQKISEVT